MDGSADLFNQRWLDYTGLSAEQARDWGWTVVLHSDDRQTFVAYWRSVLASGKPGEIEGRLRRSDGVYRWFLFRAIPSVDDDGRVVKWFGTNTDIEDRKRAEDALRSNEQNLRLIVDTVPGFVCALTPAGDVELVNRQVLEYFGKTLEELKNWGTTDAVHPDDLPRVIDAWKISVETGQPYDIDHRLRRADGVYRWFRGRGLPLRDAEGHVVRWYNLLTDIDDRKRAEALLAAEKRTLEMIANGACLADILESLCDTIDAQAPNIASAVMLIETDGKRLLPMAGPRLPKGWIEAITALKIGPGIGSCGSAAFLKERVIVSDIATDPLAPLACTIRIPVLRARLICD